MQEKINSPKNWPNLRLKKKLPNFKIPKKENENQGKSNLISTGNGKMAPMATTPISNFKIPKKSDEDKIKEKHLTKEIKQDDFVFKIPKPIDKKYKANKQDDSIAPLTWETSAELPP